MEIVGRGGASLRERWGDDPKAYLGITVPGFPNLFCLYGPGTNLAHAGSIIFHSECQVRYVMGCLAALLRNGHATMDCRQDVHDAYYERFDAKHRTLVWSHRHGELVQERRRPRHDDVAVAARRLLGLDEGAESRRLRPALRGANSSGTSASDGRAIALSAPTGPVSAKDDNATPYPERSPIRSATRAR